PTRDVDDRSDAARWRARRADQPLEATERLDDGTEQPGRLSVHEDRRPIIENECDPIIRSSHHRLSDDLARSDQLLEVRQAHDDVAGALAELWRHGRGVEAAAIQRRLKARALLVDSRAHGLTCP